MKTTMSPVASVIESRSASPLPLPLVEHDARAVRGGDLARAIARVAVDDEHLVGVRPDGVDDLADQPFFIPGGDDDGDALAAQRAKGRGHRGQGKGERVKACQDDGRDAEVRIGELVLYDQWFMARPH